VALAVADRGYVLETGAVVLQDRADALRTNEDLKRAYLGG
jgi:branched-chain amino acid transport system ATP-binding protein